MHVLDFHEISWWCIDLFSLSKFYKIRKKIGDYYKVIIISLLWKKS